MIDSANMFHVDAHFCVNDTYIRQNESGYAELTDYARQHIDECCLIFDIKARGMTDSAPSTIRNACF